MKVAVILPAAGLGTRMSKNQPEKNATGRKQFLLLDGEPVLLHTIRKFSRSQLVTEIVVALRGDDIAHVQDLAPVSPSEVSAASGISATTLRDNIQRLVDRKLVRRVRHPQDGRSYLLVPTPRGRAVAEEAGNALLAAYLSLEARLPRSLASFEKVLEELNART